MKARWYKVESGGCPLRYPAPAILPDYAAHPGILVEDLVEGRRMAAYVFAKSSEEARSMWIRGLAGRVLKMQVQSPVGGGDVA